MVANYGMGGIFEDLVRVFGKDEFKELNASIGNLTDRTADFNRSSQDFAKSYSNYKKLHYEVLTTYGIPGMNWQMALPSVVAWMPVNNINESLKVWAKKTVALRESMYAIYFSLGEMKSKLAWEGMTSEASRISSSQIAIRNSLNQASDALGLDSDPGPKPYPYSEQFYEEFKSVWEEEAGARGTTINVSSNGDPKYWEALQAAVKRYTDIDLPIAPATLSGGMGTMGAAGAIILSIIALIGLISIIIGVIMMIEAYNKPMLAKADIARQTLKNVQVILNTKQAELDHVNNLEMDGKISSGEAANRRKAIEKETDDNLDEEHKRGKEALDNVGVGFELTDLLLPIGALAVGGIVLTRII